MPQKSFSTRYENWKKKGFSQKLVSLWILALKMVFNNAYVHRLIRTLSHWKPVRMVAFDSANPNACLLASCDKERFIVPAFDEIIARTTYVWRYPFDYGKLEKVIELLGNNFAPSLLIEVGANIGTICIPAVNRNLFKHAIAVEPIPENYAFLTANISLNHLSGRIKTHPVALGNKLDEVLLFELSENNSGDHRVRLSNEEGALCESQRKTIKVRGTTLDNLITEFNPSETLIWLDTQGFEAQILSGAPKALSKKTPLAIEFWPYGLARGGTYEQLKETLLSNDYTTFYEIGESDTPIPLSEASLDALYKKIGEDNEAATDILIV